MAISLVSQTSTGLKLAAPASPDAGCMAMGIVSLGNCLGNTGRPWPCRPFRSEKQKGEEAVEYTVVRVPFRVPKGHELLHVALRDYALETGLIRE